jgi:hypothetical protein
MNFMTSDAYEASTSRGRNQHVSGIGGISRQIIVEIVDEN